MSMVLASVPPFVGTCRKVRPLHWAKSSALICCRVYIPVEGVGHARMGFGVRDEFVQGLPWRVVAHDKGSEVGGVLCQEREVLEWVVGELLDEGGRGRGLLR